ncbi:hypothetical protein PSEUDO9AZ_40189 [Pseudomonas sp. 9AZ]|uniref:hypothetical protein n=1 Tax=Pseudomonas sp. 9AZ TaxID=2653168 RepID=UPI0012F15DAC|nr:hypothetical protein [Pseudomonas sp. 9AZ]VXD00202.1 hypothetical protein PSEUDO9AZ_40189 [Pseudomonas sp. 9AZ]
MNSSKKSVIVRDRQGILYAIPAESLKGYSVPDSDFDAAATFYTASDDDVTGQGMMTGAPGCGEMPWDDMPWSERPINSRRLNKPSNCL